MLDLARCTSTVLFCMYLGMSCRVHTYINASSKIKGLLCILQRSLQKNFMVMVPLRGEVAWQPGCQIVSRLSQLKDSTVRPRSQARPVAVSFPEEEEEEEEENVAGDV